MPVRLCAGCFKPLKRRPEEKRAEFLKRKCCNADCLSIHKKRFYAEKRAAQDAEDEGRGNGLEFDFEEMFEQARKVAPDIPAQTISEIIYAVLPLIESTTRARVLAPIAANIRNNPH